MASGDPRPVRSRVAVLLVSGVGDVEEAGSTAQTVARGLTTDVDNYSWDESGEAAGDIPVAVPSGSGGSGERYDATRRRLVRDDGGGAGCDEIDLIEMRWADLSSFPGKGLLQFFGSLFGVGLQLATVGLEGTPSEGRRNAGWVWLAAVILIVAGAAALAGARLTGSTPPTWLVLSAVVLGAALFAGVLIWSRRWPDRIANALMDAASWWLAAIVVPITVMAAVAATALWLVVDDTVGIDDRIVAPAVAAAGLVAMRAVGVGVAGGGWVYGTGWWAWPLNPRRLSVILYLVGVGVGAWRVQATDSIEGGLSQTGLIAGAFAVRPAWMVSVALIVAALVALLVAYLFGRDEADGRRAFTTIATTLLSPLVVALTGVVLVGGIGAVAFKSAEKATWGADAEHVRCLADASSWEWSQSCGSVGQGWGPIADAIGPRLKEAEKREAAAKEVEEKTCEAPCRKAIPVENPALEDGLEQAEADRASAARLRAATADLERDAGVAPAAWASDVFAQSVLPLLFSAALLGGLLVLLLLKVFLLMGARRGRKGAALTDSLRLFTGRPAAFMLLLLGVGAAVGVWLLWPPLGEGVWGPDPGNAATIWGSISVSLLGAAAIFRVAPVDPRKWREEIGGPLKGARKGIDLIYDVATYLRIDRHRSGIRTRVVARFREVLRMAEDRYDRVVVVAHSQGSMYAVATLFGDKAREEKESGGWGVAPWVEARPGRSGTPLALLTFGCPLRQTYAQRLPGQYRWLADCLAPGHPPSAPRLRPLSVAWVNVYRPRDYIGRAVFDDPFSDESIEQGKVVSRRRVHTGYHRVDLLDVCLKGSGNHVGYFGDRELTLWLDNVIRRTLREPPDSWPTGYGEPKGPPTS